MMIVIGVASTGFKNFNSFREISSKPQLVLDDKLSMILLTSLTLIWSKWSSQSGLFVKKFSKCLPLTSWISWASFGPIFVK